MDSILNLHNVTKIYGNKIVVNKASFSIKRGSVCGLLGPNGAGKTTIMKMIMNEVKCDEGFIEYDENLKIKYLQDVPSFYEFYRVSEYLKFLLDISQYDKDKDSKISEVLNLLDLNDYRESVIGKLSRGLRQKVGIASVIIDEPDVLILDEPVSALDPIGRKEIFDVINALRGKVTIVFSSHILNDIERICDYIIMINKGNIILCDELKNISICEERLLLEFASREDLLKIKDKIEYKTSFSSSIANCLEICGEDISKVQKDVMMLLVNEGIATKSILVKRDSLEEVFFKEVRNNA